MKRRDDYTTIVRGCVYGLRSSLEEFLLDNIRYVGISSTGDENSFDKTAEQLARYRLNGHRSETLATTYNMDKVQWMNAVHAAGGEILIEILSDLGITIRGDLGNAERRWVTMLGGPTKSPRYTGQLFNQTWGGDGSVGRHHTEEARRKMSEDRKGRKVPPRSDEWKRRQSLAQTGKKASPETRQLLSDKRKGRPLSLEHRAKIGLANTLRIVTPEQRQHQSNIRKGTDPSANDDKTLIMCECGDGPFKGMRYLRSHQTRKQCGYTS